MLSVSYCNATRVHVVLELGLFFKFVRKRERLRTFVERKAVGSNGKVSILVMRGWDRKCRRAPWPLGFLWNIEVRMMALLRVH